MPEGDDVFVERKAVSVRRADKFKPVGPYVVDVPAADISSRGIPIDRRVGDVLQVV